MTDGHSELFLWHYDEKQTAIVDFGYNEIILYIEIRDKKKRYQSVTKQIKLCRRHILLYNKRATKSIL